MPTLYDARGNEIRGLFPDRVNGEVNTDSRTFTNLLAAANAEVLADVDGCSTVAIDVRTGAGSLTYVFEGTVDGTNYFPLPALAVGSLVAATAASEQFVNSVTITTTHSASYFVGCSGYKRVRVRVSAFTSGNITVALRASGARIIAYSKPLPTVLWVTVTAAANTGATATLPAAGVGLFHYITYLNMMRNATAALAGTATLLHTSANLPGSPVWSVGNAMAAGGTQIDVDMQLANPLKSLVANTNTTFTMPAAGAAVLNRINVGYYVGL